MVSAKLSRRIVNPLHTFVKDTSTALDNPKKTESHSLLSLGNSIFPAALQVFIQFSMSSVLSACNCNPSANRHCSTNSLSQLLYMSQHSCSNPASIISFTVSKRHMKIPDASASIANLMSGSNCSFGMWPSSLDLESTMALTYLST